MGKNLHLKAFDEGTKIKLQLYDEYIKEWLPVFLSASTVKFKNVNVFDFFCGPGKDINGHDGSPVLAINSLFKHFPDIISKQLVVTLYFNEFSNKKLEELRATVDSLGLASKPFKMEFSQLPFKEAFEKLYPVMTKPVTTNFLFLDQNGIKEITPDVFRKILNLRATDFMFFISSSTLSRFCEHAEIKKYIDIPKTKISAAKYYHIHREIVNFYKTLIPAGAKWYLAPFSIKKGANIYGLIFGSSHVLGIEKFLRRCWAADEDRGEANFNIDEDVIDKQQANLFDDHLKPRKMVIFERDLKEGILSKNLKTNKDIYEFTLENGFLPDHARDLVRSMIKSGEVLNSRVSISYGAFKDNDAMEIRVK